MESEKQIKISDESLIATLMYMTASVPRGCFMTLLWFRMALGKSELNCNTRSCKWFERYVVFGTDDDDDLCYRFHVVPTYFVSMFSLQCSCPEQTVAICSEGMFSSVGAPIEC